MESDMPTSHNSPIYSKSFPAVDAASVQILRHAGALILGNSPTTSYYIHYHHSMIYSISIFKLTIIGILNIGKTVTTEFAASTRGGPTGNPHDTSRTPGGSSSGSGAAVADFHVPLALGTQTVGSVIRPSSFNGVYALKPTWNSISREGQKIYSLTLDTLGMFARSVEDLQLLASVFELHDDVNVDKDDSYASTESTQHASTDDNDLKSESKFSFSNNFNNFALIKTMLWPNAGPGTEAAIDKAVHLLRTNGAKVEELELPPEFQQLPSWQNTLMIGEGYPAFLPDYRTAMAGQLDKSIIETVEKGRDIISHKEFFKGL